MSKYDFGKIEKKWQKKWLEEKVFKAGDKSKKPKYYQLDTFPYPSAVGLHVGHPKGYIGEDIHAHYMRMKGHKVLYTMGWDAFGLPTENYAIKIGKAPREVAEVNIKNFKRQIQLFGFSYDWDREINTASPDYYKWTQWLFIQLFKKKLAYRKKARVNWCPKDQTVLANEQVINGKCERCDSPVEQKDMNQWFFKVTDYAERLLKDLEGLDWPEATVKRQKDWIGKSEGALIDFKIAKLQDLKIQVFTTRPDTLFGATYMVLAPEHPLIESLKPQITNYKEVEKYVKQASRKTELMRQEETRDKTGVGLKGVKAINPATKEEISIWIADYVLMSYGTGAIMAVPAHDTRDFEFARKNKLPIKMVVCPNYPAQTCPVLDEAYEGEGYLVDSGKFDGMKSGEARAKITKFVGGEKKIQYKIRDWLVSRQRYWGAPIPMIHCKECGIAPVPESELPVFLPILKDYRPKGKPPLAGSDKFMKVKCPSCGGEAKRDPETLDTFVDSSWYYLRYTDPQNNKEIFNKKKAAHWLPVDLYVIGAEHTVLHLLYSRFITKFLYDEGYLKFAEPFLKLRHQGLILGEDNRKMSKRWGNVVNPDDLVKEFGADTVRLYEMFMGPFEEGQPWSSQGVIGVHRFLNRVWRYFDEVDFFSGAMKLSKVETDPKVKRILHQTIKKVTEDIESLKYNTAVSQIMILFNALDKTIGPIEQKGEIISQLHFISREDALTVVKILHPFAPHMAQELWSKLGHDTYLDFEEWPAYDPKLIEEETFELVVQINGKVRATISAHTGLSRSEAEKLALGIDKISEMLKGKKPRKIIFVPDRLINFVV
jgi:leucyl-tRNA synthetase